MADFKDDLEILNYALTLEHFESAMYKGIVASGKLTGVEQTYATDFGAHEAAHVTALTDTISKLGGTPVKAQASYNFPAFDTRDNIVKFLVTVEDLGAGAYLAAAPEVQNPDVLTAAVAIHNIEGEHASIWRRQNKMVPVVGAFAAPVKKADVLAAVSPLLGSGTTAAAPAATGTGSGTAAPAATGTGGGTAAGAPTTLPRTGNPQTENNTALTTTLVAGAAAVAAGLALRARSYKRSKA